MYTMDLQQLQQNEPELGNTISSSRWWFLTINNPQWEVDTATIIQHFDKYAYQLEEGESKTPHIQAILYSKSAKRFDTMKRLFPRAHIKPSKKNRATAAVKYCTKLEGRLREGKVKGFPKPVRVLNELRDWQLAALSKLDTQNERQVLWIVDEAGGKGKTSLAKYLCVERGALYLSSRASDIKYCIYSYLKENPDKGDDLICCFDFTRSIEDYVSYQAIEEVKNGIFFNNKYESGMCVFNNPKIIIFSNFYPNEEKLTTDRWVIVTL